MRKHAQAGMEAQSNRTPQGEGRASSSSGYVRDQGSDLRVMRADEDLVEGITMRGVIWRWQVRRRRR